MNESERRVADFLTSKGYRVLCGGWPDLLVMDKFGFTCIDNQPVGIAAPFQRILGRAYPRAAPGRLQSLTSEPATGTLHLSGDAGSNPAAVDLWVPAFGGSPVVNGTNVTDIRVTPVSGGYRVTAMAGGSYELAVTR